MTPARRRQDQTRAEVVARAKPLAVQLARLLGRLGELEAQRVLAEMGASAKARELTEAELRDELITLLSRFGIRQAASAAERSARQLGGDLAFRGTLMRDAVEGKPTRIKWFWEYRNGVVERVNDLLKTTKDEVRASVRQIVAEAQSEAKVPSMGEIARRIHSQFHGREADGRIRVFSPERAAIIAQTELAQAENTGIVEGYKATGVDEIEWLARLGSERHGHMNGKRVKLGEYFVTERGNRLRYPGDPSAPIGETINCQCTTAPVIRRRTAKAITATLPDAITLTHGEVATLKLRHGRG